MLVTVDLAVARANSLLGRADGPQWVYCAVDFNNKINITKRKQPLTAKNIVLLHSKSQT